MFQLHYMQPQTFLQMRADLASMWSPSNRSGNPRRTAAKDCSPVPLNEKEIAFDYEGSLAVDADVTSMKVRTLVNFFFLSSVLGPFFGNECKPDLKY